METKARKWLFLLASAGALAIPAGLSVYPSAIYASELEVIDVKKLKLDTVEVEAVDPIDVKMECIEGREAVESLVPHFPKVINGDLKLVIMRFKTDQPYRVTINDPRVAAVFGIEGEDLIPYTLKRDCDKLYFE